MPEKNIETRVADLESALESAMGKISYLEKGIEATGDAFEKEIDKIKAKITAKPAPVDSDPGVKKLTGACKHARFNIDPASRAAIKESVEKRNKAAKTAAAK